MKTLKLAFIGGRDKLNGIQCFRRNISLGIEHRPANNGPTCSKLCSGSFVFKQYL